MRIEDTTDGDALGCMSVVEQSVASPVVYGYLASETRSSEAAYHVRERTVGFHSFCYCTCTSACKWKWKSKFGFLASLIILVMLTTYAPRKVVENPAEL
jgi:hypothetical protein